jgi:hypothetical protein
MTYDSYLEKMKTALVEHDMTDAEKALNALNFDDRTKWGDQGYKFLFTHSEIAAIRAALKNAGKVDGLVNALETISRMKTLPDHASNTFTLSIAHKLAQDALAEFRKQNA